MFYFNVNFIAVLVTAAILLFMGAACYSSALFGKTWQKLQAPSDLKQTGTVKKYVFAYLANVILTFFLSNIVDISASTTFAEGMMVGLGCWLGFITAVSINEVIWERKPLRLYLINMLG